MEGYSPSYSWLPCNPYFFFFLGHMHGKGKGSPGKRTGQHWTPFHYLPLEEEAEHGVCAILTWLWTSNTNRHTLQVCQLKTNNFLIVNLCFDLCKQGLETLTHHSHSVFYSMVWAEGSCYVFLFTEKTWLYSFRLCLSSSTRLFTTQS